MKRWRHDWLFKRRHAALAGKKEKNLPVSYLKLAKVSIEKKKIAPKGGDGKKKYQIKAL